MKRVLLVIILSIFLLSGCIEFEDIPTATVAAETETSQATTEQPTTTLTTQTASASATTTITPKPSSTATLTPSFTPSKTATKTTTPTPTQTNTATKTATLTPTKTVTKTATPTPTKTLTSTPYPYALQTGVPVYLANFGYPDADCEWMGVGGQIFNQNGDAISNLVVWIRGTMDGTTYENVVLSGTAQGNKYGPGGYEAVLGDTPFDSSNIFSIQILDLNGNILSEKVYFDTYSQCDQNLIIINFVGK